MNKELEYKDWESKVDEMLEHTLENTKWSIKVSEVYVQNTIDWYKEKFKSNLEKEIKEQFLLLKSLNKQIYYEK